MIMEAPALVNALLRGSIFPSNTNVRQYPPPTQVSMILKRRVEVNNATKDSRSVSKQLGPTDRNNGRRVRSAANRRQNGASTAGEELRVDTRIREEVDTSREEEREQREAGRTVGSTGSEHSDQQEEPVIPVTVLPSMEAETKAVDNRGNGFVPAEHVPGKDEGEETEDDIALLEYLSGAESDYYELERASRKGEDPDDQTPIMSLSPRSFDESLGTPGSPEGLLSVDEHGGFGQSPIRYTTVTRRTMVHAQEAPRQPSTQVVQSPPGSRAGDFQEAQNTEAKQATLTITPRQITRPRSVVPECENDWVTYETEDGLTYYYNQRTHESQWTMPTSTSDRSYTTEELFAAVSTEELSETDSRYLTIMLHSGMDLQAVNADGLTPLHVASQMGNEQAASLLVYYGAKLDARAIRDDATPLILACRAESEGIAKLLVESNASLSACDSGGNTALHVAVFTGSEDLVMLVLRGYDHTMLSQKNNEGETPLHTAAKLGNFGIVRSLLAYGASTTDEDSQGRTPLILSILENHVECVQLLQSVDSNKTNSDKPATSPYYSSAYLNDRRQGSGTDRDALTVLHSYLFQILPSHSASEAQTVYQLVEEVRGQIGALHASLQLRVDTQNQLSVRELELDASRVSHRALSSRCELLESIARSAQERLGRERLERNRYEECMQEKLHHSLQENAHVIEACRQLQAAWSERQQLQQFKPRLSRRDSQGFYEIPEELAQLESVQESIGDNYHLLETEGSTSITSGNQSREQAPSDYQHQHQHDQYQEQSQQSRHPFVQYQYGDTPEILDAPPPLLDEPDELPTQKSTPPISPSRVGAVWNRFFENVGHVSDTRDLGDSQSYEAPSFGRGQPALPFPSVSIAFDAVRKSDLRKLQELGDIDSVMLLSEFAADLEARDEAGNTPLLAACFQGNFECVKFLLQSAVSLRAINDNGDSALHLAAWDGSIQCVMILLEYGVDPMATNRFGLTALGNMKTRSPMRHKFDDLSEDHPMRRTLMVLDEAEQQRLQVNNCACCKLGRWANTVFSQQAIEDHSTSTEGTTEHQTQSYLKQDGNDTPQWLLGFRNPPANDPACRISEKNKFGNTTTSTTLTEDNEGDSEDAPLHEESRLILNETKYEPLRPPPEIEEALRRAKTSQLEGNKLPRPLPSATMYSPASTYHVNLSPGLRNPTKPHPPAAPTKIRARYVDTFNTT
ncbi:unnamed protein product [Phytophthora fragariaefolia]|uniref:Unnamed protein product n=1 Tax=Phytophthora fragariaefolia TaxID=1490495 RepID=A0A9W7D1M6_9STRA|nr:unnamed protein product [Phytophthora fragariaefolia]